jgi:uncharacterized SAM-dependent methyltransferase
MDQRKKNAAWRAHRLTRNALADVPLDQLQRSERLARLADAADTVAYFKLAPLSTASGDIQLNSDGTQTSDHERAARRAFAETPRRIIIEDQYKTPAIRDETGEILRRSGSEHFQDLLDSSHRGGAYFPTRVQELIIRQHLIPTEDKHYIEIGAANGELPALITKLNGVAARYSFIDIVDSYLGNTVSRLMDMGVPLSALAQYHADYTDPRFFTEVWDRHIALGDDRKKTIHCHGNTLNNESLDGFLRNLRPRLKAGDAVHIGVDSTLDEDILVRGYCELEPWLKNGTHFTIERSLGLQGFNPDLLTLIPGISKDGHRTRVHFDMFNMAVQELFSGRPNTTKPSVVLQPGEKIDCEYSDRYAPEHYLQIFKQAGFRAISDMEVDKPFRLKCDTEDHRINYNVWRLIPING